MRNGVERADVVIIGGGIMGTSAALWLAHKGLAVTLCEKGEIGREQSGRNWGWCRTFGRDIRELELELELELSLLSLRLWRGMNDMIGRETGFRQSGILSLADDNGHLGELRTMQQQLAGSEAAVELINSAAAARLTTGAVRRWPGGLYAPTDGRAEPRLAAPAIAEGARDRGARIKVGCAVHSIDLSGGRVSAVETSRGRIDCDAVVIAAGAWSTKLCRHLGFRFPQLIVNETVSRTAPVSGGPEVSLRTKAYSLRRRLNGGYAIGGGGKIRAELTPDNFRFFRDFIPILCAYGRMIRLHPTATPGPSGRRCLAQNLCSICWIRRRTKASPGTSMARWSAISRVCGSRLCGVLGRRHLSRLMRYRSFRPCLSQERSFCPDSRVMDLVWDPAPRR